MNTKNGKLTEPMTRAELIQSLVRLETLLCDALIALTNYDRKRANALRKLAFPDVDPADESGPFYDNPENAGKYAN